MRSISIFLPKSHLPVVLSLRRAACWLVAPVEGPGSWWWGVLGCWRAAAAGGGSGTRTWHLQVVLRPPGLPVQGTRKATTAHWDLGQLGNLLIPPCSLKASKVL